MVSFGRIDAMITGLSVELHVVEKLRIANLREAETINYKWHLAFNKALTPRTSNIQDIEKRSKAC